MKGLWSIVSIVLGLILVVGLHELGHALAAFLYGVNIKRVSIGFGRPLLIWKDKRHIEWVWALWPLGGFVHLQNARIDPVDAKDNRHSFDQQTVWARFVILAAGVLMNLLVAWVSITLVFHLGFKQSLPVIANVLPDSMAAKAGLNPHDQIISMAGHRTTSWQRVIQQFVIHIGREKIIMVVKDANGQSHAKILTLAFWHTPSGQSSLLVSMGIQPDKSRVHVVSGVSLWQAAQQALYDMKEQGYFFCMLFKQLLAGAVSFSLLLGPLGLFLVMVNSFYQGLTIFLSFIGHLSLAVAFINLLPVPGLDGGAMLYLIWEKITGKPPSIAFEVLLYRLMLIVFCLVLLQLLMNDSMHVFRSIL